MIKQRMISTTLYHSKLLDISLECPNHQHPTIDVPVGRGTNS